MSTILNIVEGYRKLLMNDVTPKAEKRAETCDKCEFKTKLNTCSICKCYLPAKVRADGSNCPKDKW